MLNLDLEPAYQCTFILRRRSGKNGTLKKGNQMISSNDRMNYHVKGEIARYLRYLSAQQERDNLTPDYPLFNKQHPCSVLVTVDPPTKRRIDPPNLYPTVKPLIDGLTDAGLWSDDNGEIIKTMAFVLGKQTNDKMYHLHLDVFSEEGVYDD